MSDNPQRGPGTFPAATVPLAVHPAPAARHPATQMSPSAVPSTLESPKDPSLLDLPGAPDPDVALLSGTDDAQSGSTPGDGAARDAAIRSARCAADAAAAAAALSAGEPSLRRHGPATQMSPMPGANLPPALERDPEHAVVDAVLPAAAFLPPAAGATVDLGGTASGDGIPHAGWGPPGAHAGAFAVGTPWGGGRYGHGPPQASLAPIGTARSRASGPLIALVVGGAVALVVGIAIVGMGLFFFSARARARAVKANADRAPVSATASTTTSTAEATPRAAPRANDGPRVQGGAKAKVSDLTAIGVDANGSRNAVNAALPRLDACFAASELEAPNHETATYDLDLAPTGVVTRAEPAAPGARAPRLDACVVSVLRGVRLPRSASGGRLKVTLAAPIRGG